MSALNLRSLTAYDGRMWWLVVVDAVLLLVVAFRMAVRSPARVRLWPACPAPGRGAGAERADDVPDGPRVSVHFGMSLLGIGDLGGGLSGELFLDPRLWQAVGLGALWGLATGFLGGLPARWVRRRRAVHAR
ncbi:hypothetical protein GCM10017687_47230 [Streptomyces echinatus]|uniref:streptophobe family protein n=1 Tax=Streptomyces echinatus TaxID=67293 RepID=UPI0031E9494B